MRPQRLFPLCVLAAAAAALALSAPARAGSVAKTVPFEMGTWTELGVNDGPVTVHRIQIVEKTGPLTKSELFRPGGSLYTKTVQIQIEFSNSSTRDWGARLKIEWLDAEDKPIDGYEGKEDLDSEQKHDVQTVTLSTLNYGLERAKTLKISIDFGP